jgi:hypothetical protein
LMMPLPPPAMPAAIDIFDDAIFAERRFRCHFD